MPRFRFWALWEFRSGLQAPGKSREVEILRLKIGFGQALAPELRTEKNEPGFFIIMEKRTQLLHPEE
jgi:hypothetical protein